VTALGPNLEATWTALASGSRAIGPITRFDASGFACRQAAMLPEIPPAEPDISPREARILGAHGLTLLQAVRQALLQALLPDAGVAPEELALFAATGMVDPLPEDLLPAVRRSGGPGLLDVHRFLADSFREIHPLWPLQMLNNVACCLVATHVGISGANAVFSSAQDAGLAAILEARAAVAEGRARAAVAAGVSEPVSAFSLGRRHLANPAPFAPGEGAGALVLETESSALARGARPLAAVTGWGMCFDPDAEAGATRAVLQAAERAGVRRDDIQAVVTSDGSSGIEREALGDLGAAGPVVAAALVSHALTREGGVHWDLLATGVAAGRSPRRIAVLARSSSGSSGAVILESAGSP
jgi:3-oxoacyl-[acyl-carrier-protein] synthase II